jgi:hypothetical protein
MRITFALCLACVLASAGCAGAADQDIDEASPEEAIDVAPGALQPADIDDFVDARY